MYLNRNGKILVGSVTVLVFLTTIFAFWFMFGRGKETGEVVSVESASTSEQAVESTTTSSLKELTKPSRSELWKATKSLVDTSPALMKSCEESAGLTKIHQYHDTSPSLFNRGTPHQVLLVDNGAVEEALKWAGERHKKVMLVAFADNSEPAGRYQSDDGGQEEDISRKTTLAYTLDPKLGVQSKDFFPICSGQENKCIISKDVRILWEKTSDGYRELDDKPKIDVVAVPAVSRSSNPECFQSNDQFTGVGSHMVSKRIELQFQAAQKESAQVLVTGAFGCGLHRYDPQQVAQHFKDALNKFGKECPETVVFAIPKAYGSEVYDAFEKELRSLLSAE